MGCLFLTYLSKIICYHISCFWKEHWPWSISRIVKWCLLVSNGHIQEEHVLPSNSSLYMNSGILGSAFWCVCLQLTAEACENLGCFFFVSHPWKNLLFRDMFRVSCSVLPVYLSALNCSGHLGPTSEGLGSHNTMSASAGSYIVIDLCQFSGHARWHGGFQILCLLVMAMPFLCNPKVNSERCIYLQK